MMTALRAHRDRARAAGRGGGRGAAGAGRGVRALRRPVRMTPATVKRARFRLCCASWPRLFTLTCSTVTATDTATSLDKLCVDTIRTLSMDAVQKANSGHPGTPMALAPLAYVLYTRVMRHNPSDPGLDRPRPLHPLGRARVDAPVLDALPDRLSDDARGHRELPPGRLADRRASGAQVQPGDRGHHGPARARGSRCRSAWRWPSGCWPRASTGTATTIVDHYTFTIASDGDIQEGVASEASSLAGHLGPRPADRLLRRQQDPAGRPDLAVVLRGRGACATRPTAGTSRTSARTCRSTALEQATRDGDGGRGPPLADHRPLPHRLRQPAQAGHLERARLAAGRGRGPPDQGGLRLGSRQALLRPRRGARALPRVLRARARELESEWEERFDAYREALSRSRRRSCR